MSQPNYHTTPDMLVQTELLLSSSPHDCLYFTGVKCKQSHSTLHLLHTLHTHVSLWCIVRTHMCTVLYTSVRSTTHTSVYFSVVKLVCCSRELFPAHHLRVTLPHSHANTSHDFIVTRTGVVPCIVVPRCCLVVCVRIYSVMSSTFCVMNRFRHIHMYFVGVYHMHDSMCTYVSVCSFLVNTYIYSRTCVHVCNSVPMYVCTCVQYSTVHCVLSSGKC